MTEIEESAFEVCWNCGCEKGQRKPDKPEPQGLKCLRCKLPMNKLGPKEFHEGTRWGALGSLAELFVDKQVFDVFTCKSCGKVEFFLPSGGEC